MSALPSKLSALLRAFTPRTILETSILTLVLGGGLAGLNYAYADAVSYTGGTYTQTFDNLFATVPANNTAVLGGTVLPNGWSFVEAGANANTSLRVDNGSSGTGDTYLYGATGSNERAFGSYASGSLTSQFGVQFTNNTGGTLTQFTLTYDGEQWKDGGSAQAVLNSLTFAYGLGNVSLTAGTYTTATQLDFTALKNNTTADATLDGNAADNRRADITFTVTGLNWADGQTLWLRWTDINDAGNDDGLAIDNVHFSALAAAPPATVTWAVTNGAWNASTGNWTGGSPTANLYKEGDFAVFSGTAGGTITIQDGGVTPGSITVSAASGTYVFTGGPILGGATLTKSGGGTLDLTAQSGGNSYGGGTVINGGVVKISQDNQLGTGGVTLGGGTLQATAAVTSAKPVTLTDATTSTFATSGFTSSYGAISGTGELVVSGTGSLTAASLSGASSLTLNSGATFTTNAAYTQSSGDLTVNSGGTFILATSATSALTSATINGDFIIAGALRLNFNVGLITGSGQIQMQTSGALLSNTSGSFGGTVDVKVVLNSTGLAFTKGDVTQATYVPGSFVTSIGGTRVGPAPGGDNALIFNRVISGNSDVNFANNSATGGGSGNTYLEAPNTYTGTTSFNMNNATVFLDISNALPTGTDVIFGTQSGVLSTSIPALDLNGRNQTIASLSHGAFGTPANFSITNNGSGTSILTVSGATTPANPFGGIIKDGAGLMALIKGGSNTLALTGANAYSGGTTVSGGTLLVGALVDNGGGPVVSGAISGSTTVQNGGTLGGLGTVGEVLVQSGGTLAPGTATSGSTLGTLTATSATLQGGSKFKFELSAADNTADRLSLGSGVLTKGSTGTFQFDFLGTGAANYTYTLLTFGSSAGGFVAGNFSFTNLAPGLSGTFALTATALDFAVVAIPEPSVLAALLGGGLLLCTHRRRPISS